MTVSKTLTVVEYKSQRVLTTEQLAKAYGCDVDNIKKNFQRNKKRFIEGKHYFKLEGEELKILKERLIKNSGTDSPLVGKNARLLILWTKRGAARHSKILDTDKAWEVFDELEDNYFKKHEMPTIDVKNRFTLPAYEMGIADCKITMEECIQTMMILMRLYRQTLNQEGKRHISKVIEALSSKIYVLARYIGK